MKYSCNDKMSDMICNHYTLLQVMSRFGIPLGFGDATIKDVCQANGVDCGTFLAVANLMLQPDEYVYDSHSHLSLPALMDYLKRSHYFFLDFRLPGIRGKLIRYVEQSGHRDVVPFILHFFDNYVEEVYTHMGYEDCQIFTYVEQLLEGQYTGAYSISDYAERHEQNDEKLAELKNILIKYLPPVVDEYESGALLFDLFSCIEDLDAHGHVEDLIFVPAVRNLEKSVGR